MRICIFKSLYFMLINMQRLFFLNGELDLSTFLLVDMGIIKYPTYNCIISDQIFSSRDDLLSYEEVLASSKNISVYIFYWFCCCHLINCLIVSGHWSGADYGSSSRGKQPWLNSEMHWFIWFANPSFYSENTWIVTGTIFFTFFIFLGLLKGGSVGGLLPWAGE